MKLTYSPCALLRYSTLGILALLLLTLPALAANVGEIWYTTNNDLSGTGNGVYNLAVSFNGSNWVASKPITLAGASTGVPVTTLAGIAVDPIEGKYYVADGSLINSQVIQAGSLSGGFLTTFYTAPDGENSELGGVRVDTLNHEVYFALADFATPADNGVFKISESSSTATAVSTSAVIQDPFNIALDLPDDLIFLTDTDLLGDGINNLDAINTVSGTASILYSLPGSTTTNNVSGVDVDTTHRVIYLTIADSDPTALSGNEFIVKYPFTVTGSGATAAAVLGSPTTLYSNSGAGIPFDINVDEAGGNLFLTDGALGGSALGYNGVAQGVTLGASAVVSIYGNPGSPDDNDTIQNIAFESAPLVTTSGKPVTYTEALGGGTAVTVDSGVSITDETSAYMEAVTITISSNFLNGDTLAVNNAGTFVNYSYNSSTGVMMLYGADTPAHYTSVLESLTYTSTVSNARNNGSNPNRVLTLTGYDNFIAGVSVPITVVIPDLAPVITAGAAVAYTAGGLAVPLDSGFTLSDIDNVNQVSASISITTGFFPGDTLNFTNQSGIIGSYNNATGVLTLSGTASDNSYQTALQSVSYSSTAADPTNFGVDTSRTLAWHVNDGTSLSSAAISTITVHAIPILAGAGNTVTYHETPGAPVILDASLTAVDSASSNLASASISISSGFLALDTLAATTTGTSITASYNSSTGVLTLSGTDTLAHYNTVLDSITYASTNSNTRNNGADPTRTLTWSVNDGTNSSASVTTTVTIPDTAPVVTAGGTAAYTAGGSAVVLDNSLALSDIDNNTQASAAISISSGFFAGDTLNFTNQNGISGSYNSSTGVLTLTGIASLLNYQTALQSITYSSSAGDPTNGGADNSRAISWTVNDGSLNSNTGTSAITVAPPNTLTPTSTYTLAPSLTPTTTPTITPTNTISYTPTLTFTPSCTPSFTPTNTPSNTPTITLTSTSTLTLTLTPSDTPTLTLTATATSTMTPTLTPSNTLTFTPTPSFTPSFTPTNTPSITPTLTPSNTPTFTPTSTTTLTPTMTFTPTITRTPTITLTPTITFTPTATPPYQKSPGGSVLLAPNPSRGGQPFSLFLSHPAARVDWKIYTIAGEQVTAFTTHNPHSWKPANVASGLYFVYVDIHYSNATEATQIIKALVVK